MRVERRPPDLPALFRVLAEHQVAYVVTGSTAALLHGVALRPGDLDIVPALDVTNLTRLAAALAAIDARPDPAGPFGAWHTGPDGERHWIEREPRPGEREARLTWRPDPAAPASFDEQLETSVGALDVVPEVSGRYEELVRRAEWVGAFDRDILVASIADQLATLTVARREKDRPRVHALRERQR
ncbi:MAG: hypothetical protein ACRDGL_05810 [Candidatus Limnocylindrales bacterium]